MSVCYISNGILLSVDKRCECKTCVTILIAVISNCASQTFGFAETYAQQPGDQ